MEEALPAFNDTGQMRVKNLKIKWNGRGGGKKSSFKALADLLSLSPFPFKLSSCL